MHRKSGMNTKTNMTNLHTSAPRNGLNVRFATREEGRKLILDNTQYYNRLTQTDIDWRAREEGATLDELIAFAQKNVMQFRHDEIELVLQTVSFIEHRLDCLNCQLPLPDEIIFVKSNLKDESSIFAYTSKNVIFLNVNLFWQKETFRNIVIAHELFHCITRHSPEFRKEMYSLVGFMVMDRDIVFPEPIRRVIMANPDVEHIDNYATFTLDGEKRKCTLLSFYVHTWAEACAIEGPTTRFFDHIRTVLVPLDALDRPHDYEEASDFWAKMGRNTKYVSSTEECLADNFSYAIVYGEAIEYQSPHLMKALLRALSQNLG